MRFLRRTAHPDSDLSFVFSSNPASPQIAYIINNGSLIRYNTGANRVEKKPSLTMMSATWKTAVAMWC